MRDFIRKTWFPTTVFAATAAPMAKIATVPGFHGPWLGIAIAMVLVPLLWWWLAGRRARPTLGWGAFAGTGCFLLVALLQILFVARAIDAAGPSGEGGGLVILYYLLVVPALLIMAVALGAAVGAIIVFLQRRWPTLGGEWDHRGSVTFPDAVPGSDLDLLDAIRKTMLATMMFVAPVAAVALPLGGLLFFLNVVVVTPPFWWWWVGRRTRPGAGRGAFAGAVCLVLSFALPSVVTMVGAAMNEPRHDVLIPALLGGTLIIVFAITGAALGSMVVLLQRRWSQ